MNILAFRHFDFDDDYALASWAEREGHVWNVRDPALGVKEEWLSDTDVLVVLGSPLSVYQEEQAPWLSAEKRLVKTAIDRGMKVLGICFGAQMIAELLGGEVYRNGEKELGWHEVRRTGESHPWLEGLPESFYSFQWHGDTFKLPHGAKHLAYSAACANQAFAYGDHVLGLQFHLEATPDGIEAMMSNWSKELVEAPYIQSRNDIREGMSRSEAAWAILHRILDNTARG